MTRADGKIRVLLVDDHAVVRAGYRVLLGHSPEIEIVAEAGSGEAACQLFVECRPDVVVLDLSLPGIGGLATIHRIVARDPEARILVFSMHEDPMYVERALANGARGYIAKSSAPHELVSALRKVAAGEMHVDPAIERKLAARISRDADAELGSLSTREFEIFCLLAEGLPASAIAARLRLSPKTVANYSTSIRGKLGVDSAAELARLAIQRGIVKI